EFPFEYKEHFRISMTVQRNGHTGWDHAPHQGKGFGRLSGCDKELNKRAEDVEQRLVARMHYLCLRRHTDFISLAVANKSFTTSIEFGQRIAMPSPGLQPRRRNNRARDLVE